MATLSIWKDTYLDLDNYVPGTPASAIFDIYHGGGLIYEGRSYRRPGAGTLFVRVNDICSDYLAQALPPLNANGWTGAPFVGSFDYDNPAQESWTFAMDWSYDAGHDAETDGFHDPIQDYVVPGMPVIFSTMDEVTWTTYAPDGTVDDTDTYGSYGVPGNVVVNIGSGIGKVKFVQDILGGDVEYKVRTDVCADYVLYYVNAFGGWDHLIVEGQPSERDAYKRNTFKRAYDNSDPENRGTVEYLNEITRSWTLRTGWLSDEQSRKMRHLLGSVQVYLYDLATGTAHPVILTNSDAPVKTYKGEGAQLVRYEIEAQLAREVVRR